MSAVPWEFLAVLLGPIVAGAGLLRVVAPRMLLGALDRAAWTWALGALTIAAFVGAWIVTEVPPSRIAGTLLPIAAGLTMLTLARRRRASEGTASALTTACRFSVPERAAFATALLLVAAALVDRIVTADASAVISGDEGIIFAMRAKLLWHGWLGYPTALHYVPALSAIHVPDYPLLDPLLQVWAFLVSGRITDVLNRIPIQAFLIAAFLASAGRVRAALRPAAAAVVILAWLPGPRLVGFWVSAQADLIVACGFLLALEAWRDLTAGGERAGVRLFACALGVLVWAEHEGSMLALAIVAACGVHALHDRGVRRRLAALRAEWAWLALPAAVVAVTWTVNVTGGFSSYVMTQGSESQGFLGRVLSNFGERSGTLLGDLLDDEFLTPARRASSGWRSPRP